ncbi:MAG: methylated-DNA--[protein]-cysteine S-methyltransferase [Verrucomicrobiota bacterium]
MKAFELALPTSAGTFRASYSDRGLAALRFPDRGTAPNPASPRVPAAVRSWHRDTERAVKAVLSGRDPDALPPLDLSRGTDFQRQVWRRLKSIRSGQTRSYGEIARELGKPGSARAVGGACGANPIPVLIPCHRVLASNGKLGGFSGGLDWKKTLLRREGVTKS